MGCPISCLFFKNYFTYIPPSPEVKTQSHLLCSFLLHCILTTTFWSRLGWKCEIGFTRSPNKLLCQIGDSNPGILQKSLLALLNVLFFLHRKPEYCIPRVCCFYGGVLYSQQALSISRKYWHINHPLPSIFLAPYSGLLITLYETELLNNSLSLLFPFNLKWI